MRYSLWVEVLEGKYIHYLQATHTEILQMAARQLQADSYILDHVRNTKVWSRTALGTEVSEDNLIKEVADGCKTYI